MGFNNFNVGPRSWVMGSGVEKIVKLGRRWVLLGPILDPVGSNEVIHATLQKIFTDNLTYLPADVISYWPTYYNRSKAK